MNHDLSSLLNLARDRMKRSRDPIHDTRHMERVIKHTLYLSHECRRSAADEQALVVAAAWHDVSRVITKKTSFIWMPFVDDMLSAAMLWWQTARSGSADETTNLAVRLILCKSLGTGAFLTRILLKRDNRELVHILKDADFLDAIAIERVQKAIQLCEQYHRYHMAYRIVCSWMSMSKHLKMKTAAAKKYLIELLRQFIAWLREPAIYLWHVREYGASFARRNIGRLERLLSDISAHAVPAV